MARRKLNGDLDLKQTQQAANDLLNSTFSEFRKEIPIHFRRNNEENQNDKGIDFQFEVEDKITRETTTLFKLQNKGTEEEIKALTQGENKGLISFQLAIKHARYYRKEVPLAVIFTLCDLSTKKIYWHPIQLDETIEGRVGRAEKEGHDSIQIYLSPENIINEENIPRLLADVKESYFRQTERISKNLFPKQAFFENIRRQIDSDQHILDQVYQALKLCYEEVNVLPPSIITKLYPFAKGDNPYTYYSSFRLITDNDALYDFFESLKIGESGQILYNEEDFRHVQDHKNKIEYVLRTLTSNVIFIIESRNKHRGVNVRYNKATHCECIRCSYHNLALSRSLLQLKEIKEDDDLQDKLLVAYMQYKFGNYLRACLLFQELATIAYENGKYVIYFISRYNLSQLSIFIRNNYWGENDQTALVKELQQINLADDIRTLNSKAVNHELLEWIRENEFFSSVNRALDGLLSEIRDNYYNEQNGGWSNNNNASELINEVAKIDSFLNYNCIIYDEFREFDSLIEKAIEAFFLSHAMEISSSLRYFDDYLLGIIVLYGKTDNIIKHFRRCEFKELKYKSNNDHFIRRFKTFMSDYEETIRLKRETCEENNSAFQRRYNNIFSNLIVVAPWYPLTNLP